MDIASIILSSAQAAKVTGVLLLAICSYESNDFKKNYNADDRGSPSYGPCQIKLSTMKELGFKGGVKEAKDMNVNTEYAAKYLRYQQDQYGENWLKMTASYNAGRYNPSDKVRGCPRNLRYVKAVQKKLPNEFRDRLKCGNRKTKSE